MPDRRTPETTAHDLRTLLATIATLKTTPRTGWVDRGIPQLVAESVAEHSFQTAIVAWMTALAHPERDLDPDRVLKLALVHDLAESLIGDLPPYDADEIPGDLEERRRFFSTRRERTPAQIAAKQALERDAAEHLLAMMPEPVRTEVGSLLHEYETRETPEARFVKEIDTLETFLQARTYAAAHPSVPLGGFTDMAMYGLHDPTLAAIRDEALAAEGTETT